MWIWLADMNFHTLRIQDSVCNHRWVSWWFFSNIFPPCNVSSWRVDRLAQRSELDGVFFQQCSMRKAICIAPWITKKSNSPITPRYWGPYMTAVWSVLLILALVSPNFIISCMMWLHYFSLSIMSGKGYLMVWGILEFKTFHTWFCWTPPDLIEV